MKPTKCPAKRKKNNARKAKEKTWTKILLLANVGSLEKRSNQLKLIKNEKREF